MAAHWGILIMHRIVIKCKECHALVYRPGDCEYVCPTCGGGLGTENWVLARWRPAPKWWNLLRWGAGRWEEEHQVVIEDLL